jgi:uncharacterized protein (DUF885 family)
MYLKGWTRDQVIAYMHENDVQALAYKMGQLKIRELRERARTQLGPRFDIKAFAAACHYRVTGGRFGGEGSLKLKRIGVEKLP